MNTETPQPTNEAAGNAVQNVFAGKLVRHLAIGEQENILAEIKEG